MHTLSNRDETRGNSDLVMAGLVSAISIVGHCAILVSAATTPDDPGDDEEAAMALVPITIRIGAKEGAAFGAKSR
jgi:hypothetical protein